jgi:uncharacterized protein YndB with AHSA1/START domain
MSVSAGFSSLADGRPAVRFALVLDHSVERVWSAITVPVELEQWFPSPIVWVPIVGEAFHIDGVGGQVLAIQVHKLLEWVAGSEYHRFELRSIAPGRCTMDFTFGYEGSTDASLDYLTGWAAYLKRLCSHLNGEFLSEDAAHEMIAAEGIELDL